METPSSARLRDDLARYYDQDAVARAARPLEAERVRRRQAFTAAVQAEGAGRVLEVGLGPGVDALAFLEAGLGIVGVDLSAEHVRLARAAGVEAQVAAAHELPFEDGTFDALWCASVLMHLPDLDLDAALGEFARVLRPGSLAAFGMWGGDGTQGLNPNDTLVPPRFFAWRTDDAIQAAIRVHASVEEFDTWSVAGTSRQDFHYQWCVARFGAGRSRGER